MRPVIILICFIFSVCNAQKATIDLETYKKSKKYSFAEKSYQIGKHSFRVVNIKPLAAPLGAADTACISAIVIDKRKYVLFDVGALTGPLGMIVPQSQPIAGGLVVLKASPYEGKTFLLLPDGKVVSLPGALAIVDTVGKCVYCVWDNDKNFKLTVFDYKNLRLLINTTDIAEPKSWFGAAMGYCFSTADAKAWYTVDFMTKSVTKGEKPEGELKPVSYYGGVDKLDRAKCCGAEVLRK